MRPDPLTDRQLNRATLARQLLLERSTMPVLAAVDHLVGLQAQVPLNPYTGLWSRLVAFDPDDLAGLLINRKVVRIVVMRGTIHLVTADDCLRIRPLVQPILEREMANHSQFKHALAGADLEAIVAFAEPRLSDRPHTGAQLRAALESHFPGCDPGAFALACRNRLALVQVPPRGVWGRTAAVTTMTAEAWLGRPLDPSPSIDELVLRYFRAFGPSSVADVASWSGLAGMREVVTRLGRRLRPFTDERGRALFDVPDAPRPEPDTPAPPRFLPEYDNVLLSHADRTRFSSGATRQQLSAGPRKVEGAVLVDGRGVGTWRISSDRASEAAILSVDHAGPLTAATRKAVSAEGRRFLAFLHPAADPDIRFEPLPA